MTPVSSIKEARDYLDKVDKTKFSNYWPHIKASHIYSDLKLCLDSLPLFGDSRNTNFCGYAAITEFTAMHDPLHFIKSVVQLYLCGEVTFGEAHLKPSWRVRNAAGTIKYKGLLDIHYATQMWYLTLAEHFKGYLNVLNRSYNKEDETTLWASTNFAKFKRMVRTLTGYKVTSYGGDIVKPAVGNLYNFLAKEISTGQVAFLYINNRLLYKKKEPLFHFNYPTHYVMLLHIEKTGSHVSIEYIDSYGHTVQELTENFFKKIVFGISICQAPLP